MWNDEDEDADYIPQDDTDDADEDAAEEVDIDDGDDGEEFHGIDDDDSDEADGDDILASGEAMGALRGQSTCVTICQVEANNVLRRSARHTRTGASTSTTGQQTSRRIAWTLPTSSACGRHTRGPRGSLVSYSDNLRATCSHYYHQEVGVRPKEATRIGKSRFPRAWSFSEAESSDPLVVAVPLAVVGLCRPWMQDYAKAPDGFPDMIFIRYSMSVNSTG